ncbi:MAG: ATP-grasp domain-containing protein [Clostridia bacterium]|nr:ATP-grasp domain-containing protein [Clostridia bacterium]
MKRACILYKKEDAAKNRVLINKYFAALRRNGYSPSLIISDRLPREAVLRMAEGARFVVNRTRDHALAGYLEAAGFLVTNPSILNETANDKLLTYERLKDAVPMLETLPLPDEGEPPLPYPFAAKPAGGHGGAGVELIRSRAELDAYRARGLERTLVQPVATETGRDMRVYVVGGRPAAAMLRTSSVDFRSNYSLGGRAEAVPVSSLREDELRIIEAVCAALPVDYAGVDIMRDHGRAVLNEIEDPVGARMLYTYTDADPALLHIEYIISKENRI